MKKIVLLLIGLFACTITFAANEDKQVLVYRHSGEVNLFYAEELTRISCSDVDPLGVKHDQIVSQVFATKDTSYIIPIADIDSVVFGNRNEIEFKAEVRVLTKDDVSWVIRVEGNTIYFKPNTPSTILPKVGEKLFYSELDALFPYGLSVAVKSVTPGSNEIAVVVENVDLADMFERFFYAGSVENVQNNITQIHKAPQFDAHMDLQGELNIGSYGKVATSGGLNVSGICVIHPLRHYYSADISVTPHVGFNIELTSPSSTSKLGEREIYSQRLPPVAAVFVPSIDFIIFGEVKAELAFNYEMERTYNYHVIWKRQNGQNTISYPSTGNDGKEQDHAKIDVTLNGSLYFGVGFNLNFCLVGDLAGVQAAVKIGPELSGKISAGVLTDLSSSQYNAEVYASGELSIAGKAKLEAYTLGRENFLMGGIERKAQFVDLELNFAKRTLHLFPEFQSSKAVKQVSDSKQVTVSTATKNKTNIIRPVETGFQVMAKDEEILATEFVMPLKEETEELQGVAAEIELAANTSKNDTVYVRPVFHYAGYTIPYQEMSAAQEPGVMPVITHMSKNNITVIAGASIIGQTKKDATTLHIGNYLPVPAIDTFFVKGNPFASTITFIPNPETIIGTWKGRLDNVSTYFTFNEDGTGVFKEGTEQKSFSYLMNAQTIGQIVLSFADQTTRVFTLKSISALYMTVIDEQTGNKVKFTRQNSH